MPWQDRYRKGSFRGVEFYTQGSDAEFGRRQSFFDLVDDESGGSAYRDLGKAPRKGTLTVYFLGIAYDAHRDDFIEALETKGPGELVHPYYGQMRVLVDGPSKITESTAEGGRASVTFAWRKYRDQGSALALPDTAALLSQAADLAIEAMNQDFTESFSTSGVSGFVQAANLDVLTKVTRDLKKINNSIDAVLSIPGNIASDIDNFSSELAELISTPQKLINTLQYFVASIYGSIDRVVDAVDALIPAANSAGALAADVYSVPLTATDSRRRQRLNQNATMRAAKGSALASAAEAFSRLTPDSAEQAGEVRDAINDAISDLLESEDLSGDTIFDDMLEPDGTTNIEEVAASLRALRAAVARHARAVAGDLPSRTEYTPPSTLPTVVIAHLLYGDATRYEEIEDRNTGIIRHPLFVPGSVAIEVLVR